MAVPVFRSSFLGRDVEMRRLGEATARSGALVSIVGPGGVGKTRLAVQAMRAHRGQIAFVDLSESRTESALIDTAAQTLQVGLDGAASKEAVVERVGRWLRHRRRLLMVLDNFEQLPVDAAAIVQQWRRAAPEVSMVVTSRRALDVEDEQCLRLEPLTEEDGVALFHQRVPQAAAPLEDDAPGVREVVQRLEGLPLAIELTASRLAILSLDALTEALAEPFELVRDPGRRGPPRQRTLWQVIDWSWGLLAPWQRAALVQLSVFRGGIPLDGARAVLRLDDPEHNALDALQTLVGASLLRVDEAMGGVPRYSVLESIRAFVAAHAKGDLGHPGAEDRHAEWFLEQSAAWAAAFGSDATARVRLSGEVLNLRAVCDRALARGDAVGIARAVRALAYFRQVEWLGFSHGRIGRASRVLAAARRAELPPSQELSMAFAHRAFLLRRAGALEEALADMQEATRLARLGGDRHLQARSLGFLANLLMLCGREEESRATFEEILALSRELRQGPTEGLALQALACHDARRGDLDAAVHGIGVAIERLKGNTFLEGAARARLSIFLFWKGDLPGALELGRLALDPALADEDTFRLAARYAYLGRTLHAAGELEEADRAFAEASARSEGIEVDGLDFEGWIALRAIERGESQRAEALITRALRVLSTSAPEDLVLTIVARAALGLLALEAGDGEAAMAQADAIDAITTAPPRHPDRPVAAMSDVLRALARACDAADRGDTERMGQELAASEAAARPIHGAESGTMRIFERLLARTRELVGPRLVRWRFAHDGRWFVPPGEGRIALERRRKLAAVLGVLVAARVESPGVVVSLPELFRGAWPDQRFVDRVAANRVYNAVCTLRGMGLAIIERSDGGYRLAVDVDVRVESP